MPEAISNTVATKRLGYIQYENRSRDRGGPVTEVVFARAIGEYPALGEAVIRAVADAEAEEPTRADDFQSLEDPPA
jgi:hypothetical protein